MFFCEEDRVNNDWPKNLRGYPDSRGVCEICRKVRDCYDVPSSALPPLKVDRITPKGVATMDGTSRPRKPAFVTKLPTKTLTKSRIKDACYGGNYRQKIEDVVYEPIWLGGDFDGRNRAGSLISIVLDAEAKPIRNMVAFMTKHGYRLVTVLFDDGRPDGREFWWMKEK